MSYSNFLNLFDHSGLSSSVKLCFNFFSSGRDLKDLKRKYERCDMTPDSGCHGVHYLPLTIVGNMETPPHENIFVTFWNQTLVFFVQ